MLFHFLFFKIEFSKQLVPNLSRNLISKGLPLRMKGIGEKSTASLKKIRFTSGIGLSLSESTSSASRKGGGRERGENIAEAKYLPAKKTLGCGGGAPGVAGGATGAAKRS